MAMAIGNEGGEDEVNSTINTTPLVDVMLVLLIIFLITTPVITETVKIKLPAERNQIYKTRPENITLSINKDGDVFWNGSMRPIAGGTDGLFDKLKDESVKVPQPEVHIRGDQSARYEYIGRAILSAQRAGIAKVAFVIEPPARN
jgi:biopolymer transport protein ExbD